MPAAAPPTHELRASRRMRPLLWLTLALLGSCNRAEVVPSFPETFVGVGVELRMGPEGPVVVRLLTDGPAEQAGVLMGDRLVAIDGKSVDAMSLGDVVMAIRGAPESQVSLTIVRGAHRLVVVVRRRAMSRNGTHYVPENGRDVP